jgi:putative flippase GtrA
MRSIFKNKSVRYLFVGIWNTIFGYFLGVSIYLFFYEKVPVAIIALICNFIVISMSFLTYKLFVFKTKNNWRKEYFRSFIIYGAIAFLSIFLLWCFVDLFGINIWYSQAMVIVCTVFISYIGHNFFTFKKN